MRMLHTMLRVGNLEQSLKFYTEVLGMTLLRKRDYEEGRFTLAFVGYGDEENHTVLELTHNWDTESYDLGNGYGHIAIGVEDAYKAMVDAQRHYEDLLNKFLRDYQSYHMTVFSNYRPKTLEQLFDEMFRNF